MCNLVDQFKDRLATLTEHGKRKAEHEGKEQHLQNITLGKGIHYSVGNDIYQEVNRALRIRLCCVSRQRSGIQLGDIGIHARPWLNDADHQQTDRQSKSRDDFKIEQRLGADPTDLLHVLHSRDAGYHGTKDNRCDDHLDQLDEAVAQRFHGRTGFGKEMPEQNTDEDCRQYLDVQTLINFFSFHSVSSHVIDMIQQTEFVL